MRAGTRPAPTVMNDCGRPQGTLDVRSDDIYDLGFGIRNNTLKKYSHEKKQKEDFDKQERGTKSAETCEEHVYHPADIGNIVHVLVYLRNIIPYLYYGSGDRT